MYRTNPSRGMSPRDRIDPRLIERYARQCEMHRDEHDDCTCRVHQHDNCTEQRHHNSCTEQNSNECDTYTAEFNYALAMVYPPEQSFQNLYCVEDGFTAGTIFRELDKPFYGPKCHGGNY